MIADVYAKQVYERGIKVYTETMVTSLTPDKVVTATNREGILKIQAKAVILAMGCRERSRGALNIPGYRPAGVFSAGTAQRLVNMEGYMPGKEVVILGSGDIGLIMARRMTLEGAEVKVVAELMPYSGGLKRNIVQCLDDFGIPLKLSHTVVDIKGRERLEGITLAQVENGKPIPSTEEFYECDTLLLSCGLIPENELSRAAGVDINPITNGPAVNESLETSVPGVFAAGNVLHVHDLVDYVSEEAAAAAKAEADRIAAGKDPVGEITLIDIAKELSKPGRDPRDELPAPILRKDVLEMKDLKPGMVLTGTVRNVIDFGVFVDIGVHQDGLVHISEVTNRRLKHPSEMLKVGDIVKVVVLSVDEKRHRISLSMKQVKKQA